VVCFQWGVLWLIYSWSPFSQVLYSSVAEYSAPPPVTVPPPSVIVRSVKTRDEHGDSGEERGNDGDDDDDDDDDGQDGVKKEKAGAQKRVRPQKEIGTRIRAVALSVSAAVLAAQKKYFPDLPASPTFRDFNVFMAACGQPIPDGTPKSARPAWFCKKWPDLLVDPPVGAQSKKTRRKSPKPKKVVPEWKQMDMPLLVTKCLELRDQVRSQLEKDQADFLANFPSKEFLTNPDVDKLFSFREKYSFCPFCDVLKETSEQTVGVGAFFFLVRNFTTGAQKVLKHVNNVHKDDPACTLYASLAADVRLHFGNSQKVAAWRQRIADDVADEHVKRRLELVCRAAEFIEKNKDKIKAGQSSEKKAKTEKMAKTEVEAKSPAAEGKNN
jgi:hypothetical protein